MPKDFTPEAVIHPAGEDDEFILIVGKNDKGRTRNKHITSEELGKKLRLQHDARAAAAEQHQENVTVAKEAFDAAVKTSQDAHEEITAAIDAAVQNIHAEVIAQLNDELIAAEEAEAARIAE